MSALRDYDIERIYPHQRKLLKSFKLQIKGSEVTVWGFNLQNAMRRFRQMTGNEVAFIPAPTVRKKKVKH
jgi:hypothetical protein